MMTHDALRSTLDYHRSLPVFAARPLTSGAVAVLSKWTEIDETRVLALLNPLLLAISACLIYAFLVPAIVVLETPIQDLQGVHPYYKQLL